MNKIFTLLLLAPFVSVMGQNVGIGTRKPLSKLHVAGDLRIDALANPKDSGLVLYDQHGVLSSLKFSGNKNEVLRGDGTFAAAATGTAWSLKGNTGTNPKVNFLGTIDEVPLHFRVYNRPSGVINPLNECASFGMASLQSNTTGFSNTAIGSRSLTANQTGTHNTAAGAEGLWSNRGGLYNVAVGAAALFGNEEGDGNTAVGTFTLTNSGNGNENTAVGYLALRSNTDATGNIGVGAYALSNNTSGNYNIAIGYGALYTNANVPSLLAVGTNALLNNTTGIDNHAVGMYALVNNKTGRSNVAEGSFSLYGNTSGSFNTALGTNSLQNNTIASRNTAIGYEALFTNTVGASNVSVGSRSLYLNKYGHSTVAIGDSAMHNNFSGNYNTGIGERVMWRNTHGHGNTALGFLALSFITTGSNNTAIGNGADVTVGSLTNATAIGYNAKVNASNKVRIGNASVTKIEGQVPFTTPSDGRFKYNISEDVGGLAFIMRLRPVTYQFDVRKFDQVDNAVSSSDVSQASYRKAELMRRTGFIAQEVEKAANDAGYNFSGVSVPENAGDHYSLSYESFVVPLVKGMQEQQALIQDQSKHISTLERKIETQQEQIDVLIAEVQQLKKRRR